MDRARGSGYPPSLVRKNKEFQPTFRRWLWLSWRVIDTIAPLQTRQAASMSVCGKSAPLNINGWSKCRAQA
jgi:hypothetical protein